MTPHDPPERYGYADGARVRDRVWYRPALRGYGYDGDIPAVIVRFTPARVVVGLLTHGGEHPDAAFVTAATVDTRVRPRMHDAPIDRVDDATIRFAP